jgi:hypothetical protein
VKYSEGDEAYVIFVDQAMKAASGRNTATQDCGVAIH